MCILFQLFSLFSLVICLAAQFSPDVDDYDAYGLKIAANNLMIVEAQNDYTQFLVQFGPFTDDTDVSSKRSCSVEYIASSQFIYTIALGKNQLEYKVYYTGEMVGLNTDNLVMNRTFVGVLSYTGSNVTIDCNNGFTITTLFVQTAFPHQEHLVMVTDPLGLFAYGFSELFTFSYKASTTNLIVYPKNILSSSTSFLPFAVDYDGTYGIISGYVDNGRNARVKYTVTVILFNISTLTGIPTPISNWSYPTYGTTWQSGLTNIGIDKYNPKFDMSVSINPTATQVLIGIQSMNTVFLFSYTTITLILINSIDNGRGIGFGKGVTWLNDTLNSIAILANVYSTNYVWSSSKIYIYNSPLMNTSIPVSIFPNIQQPLYSAMSSIFLNIITTPDHLVLLDDQGSLFVILSAPSGYYSSTVGPDIEIVPAFSSQLPCIPGTYKNVTGIRFCRPCPTGTKADGSNLTLTNCINCAMNTFCPLGSTSDSISSDQLNNVTQAVAYPKSPDVTGLDDVLFLSLFSIGSSSRCIVLSPLFWALIAAAIGILIASVMLIIKYYIKHPKAVNSYKTFQKVFKQTDLIRAGELWSGGLATLCILVLCIFCCIFSANYYVSYPIETVGPSTYTCDTSIRNAQFSSSLQSSSVPLSESLKDINGLLDDQVVNFNVAFLNTIYNCTSEAVTLEYLLSTTWLPVSPNPSCNSSNYIVSYSALLPFRDITIKYTLPNIYIIGGIRLGISAPGKNISSRITVQDLGFYQTFSRNGRMLGQDARITLQLTKVINSTSPLKSGADDILTGIWIGSFMMNYYESFITDMDYLNMSSKTSTSLTVIITETPFYILNEQSPIARLPEIIYHDFLFITMIIGMFVLLFLIAELLILPIIIFFIRKCKPNFGKPYETDKNHRSDSIYDNVNNSISNSNRKQSSKYKQNTSVIDQLVSPERNVFTLDQYANYDGNSHQQSMWNRQAYRTIHRNDYDIGTYV